MLGRMTLGQGSPLKTDLHLVTKLPAMHATIKLIRLRQGDVGLMIHLKICISCLGVCPSICPRSCLGVCLSICLRIAAIIIPN